MVDQGELVVSWGTPALVTARFGQSQCW